MSPSGTLRSWRWAVPTALAALLTTVASAQSEGGLYIAGDGFSFQVAAERALAQNPGGRRFFVLALPSEAAALSARATPAQRRLRERVVAANGVLMVCQRDLDNGRLNAAQLQPEVVPVRGWSSGGSNPLPPGERYFPGEDRSNLPAANEALRQLRATCS